ncbi:MAG: MFS transporter [Deltaproteobacteria bacterium]|nr:MFS transporter [Deltaproteobacteria bacterium]
MPKKSKKPKIFFGWWTVFAGGLLALWGHGFHAYGISALFKPIATELGFNRTLTSVAASIGRLEGGFEGPLAGWITDKFGPKWIVFIGAAVIGVSLVLMSVIQSLWHFYIVWGLLLGTGVNIALAIPLDTAISNWFVKKRGTALSIKWLFSGLSGVLVMPLIAWLITTIGWRKACLTGGIVMLIVGLPLVLLCFRSRRPEYYGMLPDGGTAEGEDLDEEAMIKRGIEYAAETSEIEFTIRQAIVTLPFWLLIAVHAVHGLVAPAINIHCIPFLTDRGIDQTVAAGMMAVMIAASIPGRLFGGYIADRLSTKRLPWSMAFAYFCQSIGIHVFLMFNSVISIYAWFILYGIGMGMALPINTAIRARFFGRKALGTVIGTSMMLITPVGVVAPIYAGWMYDTTGSYQTAFIVFTVLLYISAALLLFLHPPKPPEEITDIRKIT